MHDGQTRWRDDKGNTLLVADFEATIVEEQRFHDGHNSQRILVLEGRLKGHDKRLHAQVDVNDFPALKWPTEWWGTSAVIYPRSGAKDYLRTAIQLASTPRVTDIYTHTGWLSADSDTYLTSNVAITPTRRRMDLNVQLPADLNRYQFPAKPAATEHAAKQAVAAMLALLPPGLAPLLVAAAFRPTISPVDFALHITGRTGTYKSEMAALLQSFYGLVSSRELPGSWSSTANAIEALAFRAKDALFVIDDFIPQGTSWQQRSYQKTADQIIRGQGNRAGRARMTDKSMMQATMYPRGIILSTGEDTPEGHSVRARMMIAETNPGDLSAQDLTKLQALKPQLNEAMALWIQHIAPQRHKLADTFAREARHHRDRHLTIGHTRTPDQLGQLIATLQMVLPWAGLLGKLTEAEKQLVELATHQAEFLSAADPADLFVSTLRGIFAAMAGHLRGQQGGVPKDAPLLGWTQVGETGPDLEWKPHGPRIGWVNDKDRVAYLDSSVAYDTIRRHSRGAITITRQTLFKRLREAGLLAQVDDARQRNTIRCQCQNATRQVLALHLNSLTEGAKND